MKKLFPLTVISKKSKKMVADSSNKGFRQFNLNDLNNGFH